MRFQEWLGGVDEGVVIDDAATCALDDAALIRDQLEQAAMGFQTRVDAHGGNPLGDVVLSKRTLAGFGQCAGAALASMRETSHPVAGWPMLRGRALDALVAHQIVSGTPEDPAAAVDEVLRTTGDDALADLLAVALDEDILGEPDQRRRGELDELARSTAELVMDPSWVPRVEVTLAVDLAGGAVRLPGRIDLLLGGPGTARPAVVMEVKSGRPFLGAHATELHHYALLCLLRHRRAPAAMALWYADGTTVDVHVPGSAGAAARRVVDAIEVLGDVWEGGEPPLSPGPHCRWCLTVGSCPRATPGPHDGGAGPTVAGPALSGPTGSGSGSGAEETAIGQVAGATASAVAIECEDPGDENEWDPEAELW